MALADLAKEYGLVSKNTPRREVEAGSLARLLLVIIIIIINDMYADARNWKFLHVLQGLGRGGRLSAQSPRFLHPPQDAAELWCQAGSNLPIDYN